MDKITLVDKINILLENSYVEKSVDYSVTRNKQRYINRTQNVEIEDNPEDLDFVNKQVNLLKQLYLRLNPSDKEICMKILLKKLIEGNQTAFNTLIHINEFEKAFYLLKRKYKNYKNDNVVSQLKLLIIILKNEWNILSLSQINDIYKWVNDIFEAKNKVGKQYRSVPSLYKDHLGVWGKLFRQTNILLVKDIGSRLDNGIDLEIHIDQETLKKNIKKFGFPEDLESTLEKIDNKLIEAVDKFDYKNCMDLIRSFTERLYEQIAKTIDPIAGNKLDSKDSEKVANFFKKHQFISEEQGKLLVSLRHFLSNLGSHRLQSEREDARLSRNMTVEFSLYLMKKLELLVKTK